MGAHVATISDLVGMRYLARLVATPNQDISVLVVDSGPSPAKPDRHAVLEASAMTARRTRIRELRQQPVRSADEQEEFAALTRELARASGLGGRS